MARNELLVIHPMKNPFQYGGVVGSDAFCNRTHELTDLVRAMKNGEKMFVYSERRFGKTSLVKLALSKLPQTRYVAVYIDLWPTDSEASFVATVARAISNATGGNIDHMMNTVRSLFVHLLPTVTMDERGKPVVTFGVPRANRVDLELHDVLNAPVKMAREYKRHVVIVYDEFQQILGYGSDMIERVLRSGIQSQKGVSYIFLGSRKHLLQGMFLDKSRPLYRAATHYPIGVIGEQHWVPFIRKRFARGRKSISPEQIRMICSATEGHPFYTQHLCYALWELCERGRTVNAKMIEEATTVLLSREQYAYVVLWESLTRNQQRFLKALASRDSTAKLFSAEWLQQHRLGSPSTVQRVIATLLDRDIIDRENGSFIILDRFFRLWLRRM
jgi:hypothetical protein